MRRDNSLSWTKLISETFCERRKDKIGRKLNDLRIIDCSIFIINRFLNQGTNYNNQGTNYKLESKQEWKESIQGKQKR